MTKHMRSKLQALAAEYARAQSEAKQAEQVRTEAGQALLKALDDAGQTSVEVTDRNGSVYRASKVESEVANVDYAALEDVLDPAVWQTVSRRVADASLVEAAVVLGQITTTTIADVTTVTKRKPYIRATGAVDLNTLGL